MRRVFTHVRRKSRLQASALAVLAVFAGASCDTTNPLANSTPTDTPAAAATTDSSAATDSLGPSFATVSYSGTPYGATDLYQTWDYPAMSGFTGAINYSSPSGIVRLLNSMRSYKIRGFLKMTGESQSTYMTNGAFDYYKWRNGLSKYNTSTIKQAIAAAVTDGTLLGYTMIDEPNRFSWNGSINKAMLDKMASYSKSLFPTLPTGATVTYYWRPTERYRVMDVIISQTWKPQMTSAQYRDAAVAAAKLNGTAIAFSLNVFAGPSGSTMTPSQIKDWATTLGKASCGMFMWKYDSYTFSKSTYRDAFNSVNSVLRYDSAPKCRRTA